MRRETVGQCVPAYHNKRNKRMSGWLHSGLLWNCRLPHIMLVSHREVHLSKVKHELMFLLWGSNTDCCDNKETLRGLVSYFTKVGLDRTCRSSSLSSLHFHPHVCNFLSTYPHSLLWKLEFSNWLCPHPELLAALQIFSAANSLLMMLTF